MRRSPVINPRVCCDCGTEFVPVGTRQIFCKPCSLVRDRLRKRAFYERTNPDRKPKQKSSEVCVVCGAPFSSRFGGLPYCNLHWQRMYTHGTPDRLIRKSKNTFAVSGDVAKVTTSKGDEFLIDSSDVDLVRQHSWCLNTRSHPQVVSNIGGKIISLHRFLLAPAKGAVVDHINGDPLDNRRCNLRICTQKENARNVSPSVSSRLGVLGISLTPQGRYKARITVNGQEIRLGHFSSLEGAVEARRAAEIKYFGEYSPALSRSQD